MLLHATGNFKDDANSVTDGSHIIRSDAPVTIHRKTSAQKGSHKGNVLLKQQMKIWIISLLLTAFALALSAVWVGNAPLDVKLAWSAILCFLLGIGTAIMEAPAIG
jgi:hypothetical protein